MRSKSIDPQQQPPDRLIQLFVEAAAAYGGALEAGNSRLANNSFDRGDEIYSALKQCGAQERVVSLLNHSDPFVRCHAATRVLEFAPDVAEPVLNDLITLGGIAGLSAHMVLDAWKKGELRFR
jgi:hypothetical protein